jgi:cysteine synthase A
MSKIYQSLSDLIGRTPLLELKNYEKKHDLKAAVVAKLEYFNPAGSVKDRIAKAMLDDAEAKGLLNPDSVIIESTTATRASGLPPSRGARVPHHPHHARNHERRAPNLLKAYGAELVLTEGTKA